MGAPAAPPRHLPLTASVARLNDDPDDSASPPAPPRGLVGLLRRIWYWPADSPDMVAARRVAEERSAELAPFMAEAMSEVDAVAPAAALGAPAPFRVSEVDVVP